MKKFTLNELEPGMVTAEDVITQSGQRILEKGMVLNRQLILRLSFYGIDSILTEDICPEAAPDNTNVNQAAQPELLSKKSPAPAEKPQNAEMPPSFSQKIKASQQFAEFQIDHSFILSFMMDEFQGYVNGRTMLQTDVLLKRTVELFDSCKTSIDLFDMLHNMRSFGNSTYSHFLNVALICRRIGKWLKFEEEQLDILTLCGLLHDIGKLKIPEEILNKPGKYTDEEFTLVKMHPQLGYNLLKPLSLNHHIADSALSHHERCDGSGYPIGLTQSETDDYAMIVSIADVYDAMTAARSYRAPLCPFQVIAGFEDDGLQKYKPQYILTFLSHIADAYRNNRVLLSDGRSANIVILNQSRLSKPVVQLADGSCIDLSAEKDLHIQTVL